SSSRIVILNEVKNQPVGVRVRATDSVVPGSILRRMILHFVQDDRYRLTPSTDCRMTAPGSPPDPTLFSEELVLSMASIYRKNNPSGSCVASPPTSVANGRASFIPEGSILNMSRSTTSRSATEPGVRVPV